MLLYFFCVLFSENDELNNVINQKKRKITIEY
jgi:hypothetical protein